jgi:tRNA(fMet)-specific endonuclease VapC
LIAGAFATRRVEEHLHLVTELVAKCTLIAADLATAHVYGRLRAAIGTARSITPSKLNDLWIASLCIQHDLPLLTNDGGFASMTGLEVIHW